MSTSSFLSTGRICLDAMANIDATADDVRLMADSHHVGALHVQDAEWVGWARKRAISVVLMDVFMEMLWVTVGDAWRAPDWGACFFRIGQEQRVTMTTVALRAILAPF
ncbi:hypothetical protein [Xanthomonas sp. GPE 39]|uniref:hypothetical protein n=1 Tax=Xanthomonas sp. GPE 39 TaxID=1583099 RepID=UPI000ADA7162|nr:hypothetical protein [Xanthomonas sp. GPE 39]